MYPSLGADTLSGGTGDNDVYLVEATNADDTVLVTLSPDGSDNLIAKVAVNGDYVGSLAQIDVETIGVNGLGGDDTITVKFGAQATYKVYVEGGVGKDVIDARALQAAATLLGGIGDDTIYGGLAGDLLDGGGDNDLLAGGAGNDTLLGSSGIDSLTGEAGNDFLDGGGNADLLLGGTENDTLLGGDGDDSLDGGAGDDTVYGNGGNDSLFGAAGNDGIFGGDGDDYLVGNEGNDEIHGGDGRDLIEGGNGNDVLAGGSISDREVLFGSSIDDSGQDVVFGGSGADTLIAGDGFDALFGEDGNDTFQATSANHSFNGGLGQDQFTYFRLNRPESVWVADRAMILNRTIAEPFFHQFLESVDVQVAGKHQRV
jgi:Ca2+-binding RTX toxin-like protein